MSNYRYSISSNRFPVWISIDYSYFIFIASTFLKIFYFFVKFVFLLYFSKVTFLEKYIKNVKIIRKNCEIELFI